MRSLFRTAAVATTALGFSTIANVGVAQAGARDITAASDVGVAAHDVILVLAGGVRGDRPTPILEDRLVTTLELFRAGAAPKILVTGDRRVGETRVMRDWLVARGVPDSALLIDDDGVDTYSSMYRARSVFAVARPLVVTQRFHLPRALYMAQSLGLPATGVEAVEIRYKGDLRHPIREFLARPKSVFDCVRGRTPRVD